MIAVVGDGVFQMNGMAELITVKRYLDRLSGSPLIFCVLNNHDLAQVTWEQRAMAGDPRNLDTQAVPDVPYAEFAELLGLTGIRCDDPARIGDAWDRAFAASGPVVIDAVVDADVPPIPPHVSSSQASAVVAALRQGDPDAWSILVRGARQKAHEFTESVAGALPGERR